MVLFNNFFYNSKTWDLLSTINNKLLFISVLFIMGSVFLSCHVIFNSTGHQGARHQLSECWRVDATDVGGKRCAAVWATGGAAQQALQPRGGCSGTHESSSVSWPFDSFWVIYCFLLIVIVGKNGLVSDIFLWLRWWLGWWKKWENDDRRLAVAGSFPWLSIPVILKYLLSYVYLEKRKVGIFSFKMVGGNVWGPIF